MGARIRDVAALAHVSAGWVSTYLNSPEKISPEKATRIQDAIDTLGYVRNDAGRQLRRGTSGVVGFVAFDVGDPFTYMVARGARRRAAEAGYRVVIADTEGDAAIERDYLKMFEEQRARGVLVSAVDSESHLEAAPIRQPTVMIDHRSSSGRFSSVSVNNVLGGKMAVEHLLDQGRSRIAFVGGPVSIQQIADRLQGAQMAVADRDGAQLEVINTRDRDSAAGREVADRIMARPLSRRPDALFCVNDTIAVGVLQRLLADAAVRLPEDLAIIGYNDVALESFPFYPISSIRQPQEALGRTAVELLIDEVDAAAAGPRPHVVFDPELVIRQSTQLASAADGLTPETPSLKF
ncbi:LacI family DNA-binding transcriptional regulator [Microbacterium sp.]|uniref:LacI family DNA-binding transcriptional regulator n=1 Tax=Microbacterium sp. TaxID=51671 RepID=UPI0035625649